MSQPQTSGISTDLKELSEQRAAAAKQFEKILEKIPAKNAIESPGFQTDIQTLMKHKDRNTVLGVEAGILFTWWVVRAIIHVRGVFWRLTTSLALFLIYVTSAISMPLIFFGEPYRRLLKIALKAIHFEPLVSFF